MKEKPRRALNKRNYWHYHKHSGELAMLAYIECSEDMIVELSLIQETSKTAQELQENLSNFIAERKVFVAHVKKNWKVRE